jgi:hypothetical protein
LAAFFFSGRLRVMVTMPPLRSTSMVSMTGDDTEGMGFNPNRRRVARRTDIVFVAAAVVAVVVLLAWTVFG